MKKAFAFFIFAAFILGSVPAALAQSAETGNATAQDILGTSAGTLPDSPFYPFKRFGESLQLFFTFDILEKAKMKYAFAQTRLAEADAMARRNKTQLADNALNEYEADLNETASDEKKFSAAGINITELADLVGLNMQKHILVLEDVYSKFPDGAKPAILKASGRKIADFVVLGIEGRIANFAVWKNCKPFACPAVCTRDDHGLCCVRANMTSCTCECVAVNH